MRVSDVLSPRSRDIEIIRYARDHGCVIVTLPGVCTELKRGALVTIDERGVRIRKLPVGSEE